MDLRFPGGAGPSSFFGSLPMVGAGGAQVVPATPEALEELLRAVWEGWIEFLIVEEGDVFVQVAGQGEGPYVLQYQPPGGADMLQVPGAGVDGQTMCTVLRKVVAGDPSWHVGLSWEVVPF